MIAIWGAYVNKTYSVDASASRRFFTDLMLCADECDKRIVEKHYVAVAEQHIVACLQRKRQK